MFSCINYLTIIQMSSGNYGVKIAVVVIILIIVLTGLGLLLYFYVIKKKISVTPPNVPSFIPPSPNIPPSSSSSPSSPSAPKYCPVGECLEHCDSSDSIKLCQTDPGEVYYHDNNWYINIPGATDVSQCSPLSGTTTSVGVTCSLGDKGIGSTFCPNNSFAGGCYEYKP